jgi:uncharacterized protein YdeI (YjbR/CyaY-like superfamily)
MNMNPKVDEYLEMKTNDWQRPILTTIRECLIECGLKEEIKWGAPTYTHHGNVASFSAFKNYCGIWFFEGAMLKDKAKVLLNAQEGKTQALRQWRFAEGDTVEEELLKEYVREAALNMEKGIKTPKKKIEVVVPKLFQDALDAEPEMKAFYDSLAPSHRKEYANHISEAKQETTQLRRLEKCMEMLRDKKGLHDKYKDC